MSIGIVGGGAIGLWLASVLTETTEVSLYVRRNEQRLVLIKDGLIVRGQSTIYDLTIKMTSEPWTEDLIILAVKQPALESLLPRLQSASSPHQALLFIQNGMTHLDLIKNLPFTNIFVGSIEHGVRKINENKIDWKGKGRIRCGVIKGESAHLMPVLSEPSFQAEMVSDWFEMLEDKLVANAIINPLTALFGIENGDIFKNPYFFKVAESLYEEIAEALRMTNKVKRQRWLNIQTICERTGSNRSSMLQDLDSGRLTEIDAIIGYILKQGRIEELPINQLLYNSIKGLEAQKNAKTNEL